MDWSLPRKLCTLGLIGALAVSLAPWSVCTFSQMSDAQIGSVSDGGPGTADTAAVGQANSFGSGFFGSVPACYSRNPIGQASWQWPAILGFFGGVLLFRRLERAEYVSRVKKASGAHVYARRGPQPTRSARQTPNTGGFIQSRQNTPSTNRAIEMDDRREYERR